MRNRHREPQSQPGATSEPEPKLVPDEGLKEELSKLAASTETRRVTRALHEADDAVRDAASADIHDVTVRGPHLDS